MDVYRSKFLLCGSRKILGTSCMTILLYGRLESHIVEWRAEHPSAALRTNLGLTTSPRTAFKRTQDTTLPKPSIRGP